MLKSTTTKLLSVLTLLIFFPSKIIFAQAPPKNYDDIFPIDSLINPMDNQWTNYYFAKEDCRCVNGDPYLISFREDDVETKNVIINLQGGGACWPGMKDCKPIVGPRDIWDQSVFLSYHLKIELGGSWNQLLIPYCDGSVYLGDKKADYDNDGQTDHWHWGRRNSMAGLNFLKDRYPSLNKIILTGCSAGGFGTMTIGKSLRKYYPEAEIWIINESGPGLLIEENYEVLNETWNLEPHLPDSVCEGCHKHLIYNYLEMLENPKTRIAFFSSYGDRVISEHFSKIGSENFHDMLIKTTDKIKDRYPERFNRFFIKGGSHCIPDRSYKVGDIMYWDWLLAFLKGKPDWNDVME